MNYAELKKLMIKLENTILNEDKVIAYFVQLYEKDLKNMRLLENINQLFWERGYNTELLMPLEKHKEYDVDEYIEKSKSVSRSKIKTFEFMRYLDQINFHIVTMTSLHLINIKYLIEEGMLDSNNFYVKKHIDLKSSLRDLLFEGYMSEDEETQKVIRDIKEKLLVLLGGFGEDYNEFPYNEFIIDTEYLLYSLNDYKKSNSIKLMFKMANKEHYARLNNQYSTKFEDVAVFLRSINKDLVNWYLNKHKEYINDYERDGYVQFYRHLEVR